MNNIFDRKISPRFLTWHGSTTLSPTAALIVSPRLMIVGWKPFDNDDEEDDDEYLDGDEGEDACWPYSKQEAESEEEKLH